jgi:hypothetical protein
VYYLIDLERTLRNGVPFYWRGNRHGYTSFRTTAGQFPEEEAKRIVESDFDGTTVMIEVEKAEKIVRGL